MKNLQEATERICELKGSQVALDALMSASASGREAARVHVVPGLWWSMAAPCIVLAIGAVMVRRRGAA